MVSWKKRALFRHNPRYGCEKTVLASDPQMQVPPHLPLTNQCARAAAKAALVRVGDYTAKCDRTTLPGTDTKHKQIWKETRWRSTAKVVCKYATCASL